MNGPDEVFRADQTTAGRTLTLPNPAPTLKERKAFARAGRRHPFCFRGVDLRKVLRGFWALGAMRPRPVDKLPKLEVAWGTWGIIRGNAYWAGGRIRIVIGPNATWSNVLESLLHEAVHSTFGRGVTHGEAFVLRLAGAAREAWGIEIESPLSIPRGGHQNKAYALDAIIEERLRRLIEERPDLLPPAEPEPKRDPKVRTLGLVAKRRTKAIRMLELNEAKFRRAQALVRKWKRKVNYYERAAAKRGSS